MTVASDMGEQKAVKTVETGDPAQGGGASAGIIGRPQVVLYRIVALSAVLLLVSQIAFSWFSLKGFEEVLKPQLERKGEVVGQAVSDLISFGVTELEIPPDRLVGVDAYFDDIMEANAEIEFMALLDRDGSTLVMTRSATAANGGPGLGFSLSRLFSDEQGSEDDASRFPIEVDGEVVTTLLVGISDEYVNSWLSDIYFDVITVIVVSWLVTVEFMKFFMNTKITSPLSGISIALERGRRGVFADHLIVRTRDEVGMVMSGLNDLIHAMQQRYEDFRFEFREIRNAQLDSRVAERVQAIKVKVDGMYRFLGGKEIRPRSSAQIRVPIFLLIFSEELSRPFLPLFISRLAPAEAPVSTEFLIGLPITLFMIMAAAFTPIGGVLSDRYGARRIFIMGAVPAVVGYFGTFLTVGYLDFIFWRSLSGIGYGLIFIASQAWVAENSQGQNRATEMSVFVGAVFVGLICGPPFGGIIAGRLGYETTFLFSAGLALASGLMVYYMLDDVRRVSTKATSKRPTAWRPLLLDLRFISVAVFAATPGKFVLTGFFFYLLPLHLFQVGNSQSVIGWLMMLYGLSTFATMPLVSMVADRTGRYRTLAASGVFLAGLGCMMVHPAVGIPNANVAAVIAILCLGVGHALSLSPQLAIVQEAAERFQGAIGTASAISAYRIVERAGLIFGPVVAAPLAIAFGLEVAIAGIGLITIAFVPLFLITMYLSDARDGARETAVQGDAK